MEDKVRVVYILKTKNADFKPLYVHLKNFMYVLRYI